VLKVIKCILFVIYMKTLVLCSSYYMLIQRGYELKVVEII